MSTDKDNVIFEDRNRTRLLTINRPEFLNAMNNNMCARIGRLLNETANNNEIAVAMITGAGEAFCSGQDLHEMRQMEDSPPQFTDMLKQLASFPKPLIAAVNGIGVGIGMTFLSHCDLVLMSEEAKLKTPFPQLGLAPEAGSSYSFIERMGWQNAAYTLLSGRWFSARECLEMNLAWRVTSANTLLSKTRQIAEEIAANPIPSLIATKTLMLASGKSRKTKQAHERESKVYAKLMGSAANKEAVDAFFEKRTPDFSSIKGL